MIKFLHIHLLDCVVLPVCLVMHLVDLAVAALAQEDLCLPFVGLEKWKFVT